MVRRIGDSTRFPLVCLGDRLVGFLLVDILLTLGQTYICCTVLCLLGGRGQFLTVGTFFHVFVKQKVHHFAILFVLTNFLPISELIVLAWWVKFNTSTVYS